MTAEAASADSSTVVGQDAPSDSRVASVARALTIGAVIGAALVATLQLTFRSDWVTKFLVENALERTLRTRFIWSSLAGAGVGALATAAALLVSARRGAGVEATERWMRFLAPLAFAPFLAMLLRHRAWADRYEALLACALVVTLAFERVAAISFASVPQAVGSAWQWTAEKLPRVLRRHGPLVIIVVAAIFYSVFMTFYTVQWHYKLRTNNFDLGINNNLIYGGLSGDFLQSPVVFGNDPGKYLAAHAKFGVYFFLPIYALYPKPEMLLAIQATSLGLSAIPLFLFARRRISEWSSVIFGLAWIAYYPMHAANFYEVHDVPIAALFVLTAIWAVDTKRWVVFWITALAAILMREDMPVGMAVAGAVLLLTGHRPKSGLALAVVATGWFLFLRGYIMTAAGNWWFPKMYKDLWAPGQEGFTSVAKTLLSNPPYVFSTLLEKDKIFYVLHLVVPLALLPLRRVWAWVAMINGSLFTLLTTDYLPTITFSFHYVMHWAPYVFVAAVLVVSCIGRAGGDGRVHHRAALAAVAFATLVTSFNYGAFARRDTFKGGFSHISFDMSDLEKRRYAELQSMIALIPPDASVAATEKLGPHVSSRKLLYSMRKGPQGAEYVLAWRHDLGLERTKPTFKKTVKGTEYGVLERRGGFVLLKKGHDPSGNAELAEDWGL